jgi:hypothetical protein
MGVGGGNLGFPSIRLRRTNKHNKIIIDLNIILLKFEDYWFPLVSLPLYDMELLPSKNKHIKYGK